MIQPLSLTGEKPNRIGFKENLQGHIYIVQTMVSRYVPYFSMVLPWFPEDFPSNQSIMEAQGHHNVFAMKFSYN